MRRRVLLVAAAALAAGCGRGGVTDLFAAAEAGDADAVRRALAAGAEP